MNEGRTVFAQLLDCLPQYEFDKCVQRYRGNFRVRKLSAYEQFAVMAFAQLTWRESLRDIETCLRALGSKLYHSGIRKPTARSTLADANETRDWRIFADFAQVLIQQAATLYTNEPFAAELQQAAYALDSTTIDLCLSLFPWATFRRCKAAIKLHTLLTLQGNFPTVVIITPGSVHDVNILDQLAYEAGSFYTIEPFAAELQQAAYALDSTTIDLCLSLFPWATFRRCKAAIKLHTLLTLQGNFPTVVIITPGSVHDVNILDQLAYEAGSFYIM